MARSHSKNPSGATDRHETAEAIFATAADLAERGEDVSMIVETGLDVLEGDDRA